MERKITFEELEKLIKLENFIEVLELAQILDNELKESANPEFYFRLSNLKCKAFRLSGNHTELLKLAANVKKTGLTFKAYSSIVDSLINISNALADQGQYSESMNVANQAEEVLGNLPRGSPEFKQRQAALLIRIGSNLVGLGEGEKSNPLEKFQQSLELYQELALKNGIATSLITISRYYIIQKWDERGLEYAQQSLSLAEEVNNKESISNALAMIGVYYLFKREWQMGLEYHQRCLVLREELGDKILISWALNNVANSYRGLGDHQKALQLYNKALEIIIQIGNKRVECGIYNAMGRSYYVLGDLYRSLDYKLKALALSEKYSFNNERAIALVNIFDVYQEQGDLEKAIDSCQQAFTFWEERKRDGDIPTIQLNSFYAWIIANKSIVHWQRGELEQAYDYSKESLDIFMEISLDSNSTIQWLYSHILLCIDLNLIEEANINLQLLKPTSEQTDEIFRRQASKIAEALLLKTSSRARYRGKAEELLESVIAEKKPIFYLLVTAMVNLADLLLLELRNTGEGEILAEIKILVRRLLQLAEIQHAIPLIIETKILHSKLKLLELDITQAQILLDEAHKLAKEKHLEALVHKTTEEISTLHSQRSKWNDFINRNASISEIMESTQIEEYLERVVHDRVFGRKVNVEKYSEEAYQLIQEWEKGN